jgi:hypothetical protein
MRSDSSELHTNRDLYLFVADLCQKSARSKRSLEDYLKVLWCLAAAHREHDTLAVSAFAGLLEAAFHTEPPPFDPLWSHRQRQGEETGYARWENTILMQIVDLHEMEPAGLLASDLRYFGVDAPRGSRWYNFEPLTFLECGVAGTFDGWRSGDSTGRDYVPGRVAVLDETGHVTSAEPGELDQPIVEIELISWDVFADFLESGQLYE